MDLAVAQGPHDQMHFRAQLGRDVRPHALFKQRPHRVLCLRNGDSLAQTGERAEKRTGIGGTRPAGVESLRQHDIDIARLRHFEAFGEDADDPHFLLVERDGAIERRGAAAENRRRHPLRQQANARRAGPIVVRGEVTAKGRREAQGPQEIGFDDLAGNAPRSIASREIAGRARPHRGQRLERRLQSAPVQVAADDVKFVIVDGAQEPHRRPTAGRWDRAGCGRAAGRRR